MVMEQGRISIKRGNAAGSVNDTQHLVRSGETLQGIAGHYGVSVDDLLNSNQQLRRDAAVQSGQSISIPSKQDSATQEEQPPSVDNQNSSPAVSGNSTDAFAARRGIDTGRRTQADLRDRASSADGHSSHLHAQSNAHRQTKVGGVTVTSDGSAIVFRTGMAIDADGSPHAYNPQNSRGLDDLRNAEDKRGHLVGVVTNRSGHAVVQKSNDPAPGFYVSATSLQDTSRSSSDPRRYVNSETIPYIVLPLPPKGQKTFMGARPGDFAVVIKGDKLCYAIFADSGPRDHLGEGSIALAKALGIDTNARHGGTNEKLTYIAFPESGDGHPRSTQEINTQAARLFNEWGGTAKLHQFYPGHSFANVKHNASPDHAAASTQQRHHATDNTVTVPQHSNRTDAGTPTRRSSTAHSATPPPQVSHAAPQTTANDLDTVLHRGMRGVEVDMLQDELIMLGCMTSSEKATGPGIFGPRTMNAVARFQRDNHLANYGQFDHATRAAMRDVMAGLRFGSRGNAVRGLQTRLTELGFMTDAQAATGRGHFGPQTQHALKVFQEAHGLEASGVMTYRTYQALYPRDAATRSNTSPSSNAPLHSSHAIQDHASSAPNVVTAPNSDGTQRSGGNQALADTARAAVTDRHFDATRHHCSVFAREIVARTYHDPQHGGKYTHFFKGTAAATGLYFDRHKAQNENLYQVFRSGATPLQPGDLLFKTHGSGGDGHVGIFVGNNRIVENSTARNGHHEQGAKGHRSVAEFGQFDLVVRLRPPAGWATPQTSQTQTSSGSQSTHHAAAISPARRNSDASSPATARSNGVDATRRSSSGSDITPETLAPVPGSEHTSRAFKEKVIRIAGDLGTNPDYLMAIMSFESGSSFNPAERNRAGSGATGLIQFMPSTAHNLGTSTAELSRMTAEQQLDYVAKYFAPHTGRLKTLDDAYMAVLYPAAIGKGSDHVLFRQGTTAYAQNSGLDSNRDGQVTVGEAAAKVRARLGMTSERTIRAGQQSTRTDTTRAQTPHRNPVTASSAPQSPRSSAAGLPDTHGMTEAQKYDLYAGYFTRHSVHLNELRPNERAILGLRVTTNVRAGSGNGVYDDREIVAWRSADGTKHVREFAATTEPAGWYEDTRENRRAGHHIYGEDANGDGRNDLGRLRDGNYSYQRSTSGRLGNVLRPTTDIVVDRDVNHDGVFDDADRRQVTIQSALHSGESILFHSGRSAACQTMSRANFNNFWESLDTQNKFHYVLVTVR